LDWYTRRLVHHWWRTSSGFVSSTSMEKMVTHSEMGAQMNDYQKAMLGLATAQLAMLNRIALKLAPQDAKEINDVVNQALEIVKEVTRT